MVANKTNYKIGSFEGKADQSGESNVSHSIPVFGFGMFAKRNYFLHSYRYIV